MPGNRGPTDEGEWATPELRRLYELVLDDLQHQSAIQGFGLATSALEVLAWSVTTQVAYGFDVTWNPKWLSPDDPGRNLPPSA